jgi:CopG family nickel-responsive transcriptional regulator
MDQNPQQLQRIGVSLETKLLDDFDAFISRQGYSSRSEAIRDLIRDRLISDRLDRPDTEAIAGVFVVYDHHRPGLTQKLVELQHSHLFRTISSMHVHIGHHDCLEVILLKGNVGEIVRLGDKIVSLKGVKLGKVNLISVTD